MTGATVNLSEFEALSVCTPKQCKVARLLEQLDPADRATFIAALDAAHISDLSIVKVFRSRDLKVGDQAVAYHRRGSCCCG